MACGSEMHPKRVFSNREDIWLCVCAVCRSEELLPQPSNGLLSEQYVDYNLRRNALVKKHFPKESFFKDLLVSNSWATPDKKDFTALELGAGGGDFVLAFKSLYAKARLTAVEMNPESERNLRQLDCVYVRADVQEYLSSCAQKFDVVFMFDVIEHLRDPLKTLSNLAAILNPGGRIVLTAPLAGSFLHMATGRIWPQYKLEHLFYFSRKAFDLLGQKAGLRICRISPLAKKLPLSYLLSVGSNFGPDIFSRIVRSASGLIPSAIGNLSIKLHLGEAFVVYEKR